MGDGVDVHDSGTSMESIYTSRQVEGSLSESLVERLRVGGGNAGGVFSSFSPSNRCEWEKKTKNTSEVIWFWRWNQTINAFFLHIYFYGCFFKG